MEEIADDNYIEFTGSGSKRAEGKTKLFETARAWMPLVEVEKLFRHSDLFYLESMYEQISCAYPALRNSGIRDRTSRGAIRGS